MYAVILYNDLGCVVDKEYVSSQEEIHQVIAGWILNGGDRIEIKYAD